MHEPTFTPRALLHAIVAEVARSRALEPEAIIGRNQAQESVQARVEVANRLLDRGIPKVQIARMLKLNSKTVRGYLAHSSRQAVHHKEGVLP